MNTLKSNLDNTDWAILSELQVDARLSYAEIGRRVGLSSPAVQERVRRLEEISVIKGYRVDIEPTKVGLPVVAYSRLRQVNGKDRAKVINIIQSTSEIIESFDITGEDGFLLKIVASSHEHLNDVLMKFTPYGQTITGIIMKTYVDNRSIDQETLTHSQTDS